MIDTNNIEQARKEIQKLKKNNNKVVVLAKDDEFNRKIFEMKDVDIVVGLEFNRRDKLKQRDSGMNEVIAKLGKTNDIKIGIDISRIQKLNRLEKAKILSRIMQNIKLCRRTGAKIILLDANNKKASSFIISLGGDTNQASFIEDFEI